MAKKTPAKKKVATLTHTDDKRTNIPTAELESVVSAEDKSPVRVAIERRNPDLDPQLVWRGKDYNDELVIGAPPLYIQEKVHPKVLIDDLLKESKRQEDRDDLAGGGLQLDLFGDFNGLPDEARSTDFYKHEANWTNRMILGDSLQVMASLAEREGLRGKVQCIYIDPPYGIKFNSNFQWSTTSRDVKDGKTEHITREPEQVKAFRDTWRDGIHSYLAYLRDRLTAAHDLLTESGSIFVQIGDENVHRVRAVMDEVFGETNFCSLITFQKTSGQSSPNATTKVVTSVTDYVIWFAKDFTRVKFRELFQFKGAGDSDSGNYRYVEENDGTRRTMTKEEMARPALVPSNARVFRYDNLTSAQSYTGASDPFVYRGSSFTPPGNRGWSTKHEGIQRLAANDRLHSGGKTLSYVRYLDDFPVIKQNNVWVDTVISGFGSERVYVVQTLTEVVQRCLLMTTDAGDLVLDPTCGSGTTAYVAEQWGRRWITIDTSRVALALARARIMGARYPFYLLADSKDGQAKKAAVIQSPPSTGLTKKGLHVFFG